jgi:hypothetical protein
MKHKKKQPNDIPERKTETNSTPSFCVQKNRVLYSFKMGARGSVVVKALCYKSDGRGLETR